MAIPVFLVLASSTITLVTAEFIFRKLPLAKGFYEKVVDKEPFTSTVNKQDFRVTSRNVIYKKNSGEYFRIICLGDSFTYGTGVGDDKTYPAFLEKYLEHICRRKVQVINAGVRGATITEELAIYKEKCVQLQHNLVILLFSAHDIHGLARNLLFQTNGWHRNSSIAHKYFRGSRIYSLMRRKTMRWRSRRADSYYDDHKQDIRTKYFENLRMLNKIVQKRNAILVIVIYPLHEDAEKVKNFCMQEHMAVIDIQKEYARRLEKGDIHLVGHHNERGNAFLGKITADKLIAQFSCTLSPLVEKVGRPDNSLPEETPKDTNLRTPLCNTGSFSNMP